MGRTLADKADEAIRAGRRFTVDRIGVASTRLRIPQRRPTTAQVELARWYLEKRPPDLDELDFTRRLYGHDYTFNDGKQLGNERHAQELLNMWQWQRGKSDEELIEELEIQVITLGDVAIAGFPVELFSDFGLRVKTGSPFPTRSSPRWPTAGTATRQRWRRSTGVATNHASPTPAGWRRRLATA